MADRLDTRPTPPVWRWDAEPTPLRPAHRGRDEADLLVVGGGLAGLATAYHVAQRRPGLRVVVAEASGVGSGATGSSTGIVGPGLSAPLTSLRRRYGDAVTAAAFAATLAGPADVAALTRAAGLQCDARWEPHVVGALTGGQERRIRRHTAALADLGFTVPWWDGEVCAARLGPVFRAAYAHPDVLLVDPYRLVTGLAAAAERLGVTIAERSPVQRLERLPDRVVAHTPGGTVAARRVLLTVDGYGGPLNPHPSSVLPIRTHVVATEPLTAQQRADLGWDGVGGVIDQRTFFSYYRLGAGGRLIFGGGPALRPTGDPRRDARASAGVFARIQTELRKRFPALRDVRIEARWSGLTGGTLDRLPVVGPVAGDPRVLFAGGWCGHGLSLSLVTARAVAEVLTGDAAAPAVPSLPWWRASTAGLPSTALRSVALPAYLRVLDWQDRLDLARPGPAPAGGRAQRDLATHP